MKNQFLPYRPDVKPLQDWVRDHGAYLQECAKHPRGHPLRGIALEAGEALIALQLRPRTAAADDVRCWAWGTYALCLEVYCLEQGLDLGRRTENSRKVAKRPRKRAPGGNPLTKQMLEDHRKTFLAGHGGRRSGWVKAACIDFKTSATTIRKRMSN